MIKQENKKKLWSYRNKVVSFAALENSLCCFYESNREFLTYIKSQQQYIYNFLLPSERSQSWIFLFCEKIIVTNVQS